MKIGVNVGGYFVKIIFEEEMKMVKRGKKYVEVVKFVDCVVVYFVIEVVELVKKINIVKFDVIVEVVFCLGVDFKKVD